MKTSGFNHGNVEPENILLTKSDGVYNVKIIDFGITKAFNPEQKQVKQLLTVRIPPYPNPITTPLVQFQKRRPQRSLVLRRTLLHTPQWLLSLRRQS